MDADISFESLPEPTKNQREKGWRRDYSSVWAAHTDVMKRIVAGKRVKAFDKFRTEKHVANGAQITLYDFTGGISVRKAKEMARHDELTHEEERLKAWKRANTSP